MYKDKLNVGFVLFHFCPLEDTFNHDIVQQYPTWKCRLFGQDKAQNTFVIWCAFHWGQYRARVLVLYMRSHRSFLSFILRGLWRICSANNHNLSYQLYWQKSLSVESTTSWAELGPHLYWKMYVVQITPHRGYFPLIQTCPQSPTLWSWHAPCVSTCILLVRPEIRALLFFSC